LSATTYSDRESGGRASPRRRALSFLLALAIEVLLLLAFFTLNFRDRLPQFKGGTLSTFDLSAESEQDRSATPQKKQKEQAAETRPPRPVPPVPKPAVKLPTPNLDMLEVTREVYQAADISKLGSNAPGYVRSADAGSSGGANAGDSAMVGTAPDGQPLYAAEWYREPTNTELAGYLPKAMPEGGGWGIIACKTAPRFRVTDCVELGQGPAGSHLAGAVRQAAWQFLVRPPRIGGKSLVGEWVRIRVDYGAERPSVSLR
jgi:protein TonB